MVIIMITITTTTTKGRIPLPNRMNFWKSAKGEGIIFNSTIYIADFGSFKQSFLSMKLIKRRVISGFRVCFSTIVLILTDTMWPMPPCINATIFIIKNLRYNFPKMRGRGFKCRLEFFKKIHPIWQRDPSHKGCNNGKKIVTTLKGCNNGKIKLLQRLNVVTMAK